MGDVTPVLRHCATCDGAGWVIGYRIVSRAECCGDLSRGDCCGNPIEVPSEEPDPETCPTCGGAGIAP